MRKAQILSIQGIIFVIISLFAIFASQENFDMANIHFYLFVCLIISDIIINRSISILSIWLSGFIYIVLSDMLIYNYGPEHSWVHRFIFLSNDVFLLGYYLTKDYYWDNSEKSIEQISHVSRIFVVAMLSLYAIYLYFLIPQTIQAVMLGGRMVEIDQHNILLSTFIGTYKTLPLIIGYYMVRIRHYSKWVALLCVMPIMMILLLNGTRFHLLFSALPFLIICGFFRLDTLTNRNMLSIGITLLLFMFFDSFIMQTRNSGLQDFQSNTERIDISNHPHKEALSLKVCRHGSPETIVSTMKMIKDHFDTHEFTYGKSTGFIFYFWIPRSLWPNKPEMLNHWLPHLYMTGISEGHSTSSGLCGEPYADFGNLSLILIFFFGVAMKKGNNYLKKYNYGAVANHHSMYALLLIPYAFFAVRSPVTATHSTIMQLLTIYLICKFFFKDNYIKEKKS